MVNMRELWSFTVGICFEATAAERQTEPKPNRLELTEYVGAAREAASILRPTARSSQSGSTQAL
jgi:hypothetical protein